MKSSCAMIGWMIMIAMIGYVVGQEDNSTIADEDIEDECGAGEVEDNYDLALHVGAVFIQLGISCIAVFTPVVLHKLNISMKSPAIKVTLEIFKFFGTGIIISTAFIHLLPASYEQFGNPCLQGNWGKYGVNFVGIFAMIAVFAMQLIEIFSMIHLDNLNSPLKVDGVEEKVDLPGSCESDGAAIPVKNHEGHNHHHGHVHSLIGAGGDKSKGITLYILEFGIALHSILIGIALSTTSNDEFIALLIALIFHQGFEGLALGARIIEQPYGVLKSLGMGLIYGLTTPFGIALGIGIRYSYDPNSQRAIISTGILESLAAGILLYNSFVGLISSEMNNDVTFRNRPWRMKALCFGSMYLGAAAMSIVGNWA